jgi:hypothetical protein
MKNVIISSYTNEKERCKVKETLKNAVDFWKSFWWKLLAFVLSGSIAALFIASFCLKEELSLSVMNEWVSLVVGMAALILGIISLILSFYNVEQSNEVQKETIEIMNEVKSDIEEKLSELRLDMNRQFSDMKNAGYRGTEKSFEGDIKTGEYTRKWEEIK